MDPCLKTIISIEKEANNTQHLIFLHNKKQWHGEFHFTDNSPRLKVTSKLYLRDLLDIPILRSHPLPRIAFNETMKHPKI